MTYTHQNKHIAILILRY